MRQILISAEKIFAEKGYGGATTQAIADDAGLPKANVHYYFPTKERLYLEVLKGILDAWEEDADVFSGHDNAAAAIEAYVRLKLDHSFTRPYASKVWASEIMQGAPVLNESLHGYLFEGAAVMLEKIQEWIDRGEIRPIEPKTLLFMIWSITQHYADFNYQVRVFNQGKEMSEAQRQTLCRDLTEIILRGVQP